MLFPIFLSYGAFKTVCNRISKAGHILLPGVHGFLLDSSSQVNVVTGVLKRV